MFERTDGRTSHRAAALLRSAVLIAGRALLLTVALMFTGAVPPPRAASRVARWKTSVNPLTVPCPFGTVDLT
jgi:hypothetical protein